MRLNFIELNPEERMSPDYIPEQPVFGPGRGVTNSGRPIKRYVRTYRVLQHLSTLDFESCLDVGAAEGYTSSLVHKLFGAECVAADFRPQALGFARDHYRLPTVAVDAHRLPFRSNAFDIVYSTETVEHLEHPVEAMLEMVRVARRAVLVSTCEATTSPILSWISKKLADYDTIGGHINFFTAKEFRAVLGAETNPANQFIKPGISRRAGRGLRYSGTDIETIKEKIRTITWTPGFVPGSRGIVALRTLDPTSQRSRPHYPDNRLLDEIMDHVLDPEEPLAPNPSHEKSSGDPAAPLEAALKERLECSVCGHPSELPELLSGCSKCATRFEMIDGVPALHPPRASIGPSLDRDRFQETVTKAGLHLEVLEETKNRLETRSAIKSPVGIAALRGGRRVFQAVEGMRRAVRYLGSQPDQAPASSDR